VNGGVPPVEVSCGWPGDCPGAALHPVWVTTVLGDDVRTVCDRHFEVASALGYQRGQPATEGTGARP
jgi:hypothetical protein